MLGVPSMTMVRTIAGSYARNNILGKYTSLYENICKNSTYKMINRQENFKKSFFDHFQKSSLKSYFIRSYQTCKTYKTETSLLACCDGKRNNEKEHENGDSQRKGEKIFLLGFVGFSLSDILGMKVTEDKDEESLKSIIRNGIYAMHKEEFEKSEELLHLALKMAHDIDHKKGITYICDVLANLNLRRNEFTKALTIFKDVLRQHMIEGGSDSDNTFIAISLKIAECYIGLNEHQNAVTGLVFCIQNQKHKIAAGDKSTDSVILYAMAVEQAVHLLTEAGEYEAAISMLKDSIDSCESILGKNSVQMAGIKNNLGSVYAMNNQLELAIEHLNEAFLIMNRHLNASEDETLPIRPDFVQGAPLPVLFLTYSFNLLKAAILFDDRHKVNEVFYKLQQVIKPFKKMPEIGPLLKSIEDEYLTFISKHELTIYSRHKDMERIRQNIHDDMKKNWEENFESFHSKKVDEGKSNEAATN